MTKLLFTIDFFLFSFFFFEKKKKVNNALYAIRIHPSQRGDGMTITIHNIVVVVATCIPTQVCKVNLPDVRKRH